MENSALGLNTALADLARSMVSASTESSIDLDVVMEEVTTWAVKFMSSVDHASMSLIRRRGKRHTFESAAPSSDVPEFIDLLQEKHGAGPCLDAIRVQGTVLVGDYSTESRWPALTEAVTETTPVRSSLSILLYTDNRSIGALNLHSETADAFDDAAIEQAEALAAHAAVGISTARREEQFRSALASRDVIGQAKGILMERFTIDALQAFRLLSRLSQEQNIPVTELAKRLVSSDRPSR